MEQIFIQNENIVLASGSPRRRAYLAGMGLTFSVVPASIVEQCTPGEKPEQYISRLAWEKAQWVSVSHPDSWIVAADTVVCLGDILLEKPRDKEDALAMLLSLSGREHSVRTAFCLHNRSQSVTETCVVSTRVEFWDVTESHLRAYVDSGEPMDKAGGYGIQGIGAFLVRKIHGSYSNVVGLPLCEFIEMLSQHKVIAG